MNSSKMRVILDTSYLLPILGVKVGEVEDTLEKLRSMYLGGKIELYYSPFSIVEALGKISKMNFNNERVKDGLTSIIDSKIFTEALPTSHGYFKALTLKAKGFKDFIDLLLYQTAATRELNFLTRDWEIIEFIKNVGEDMSPILQEEML